MTASFLRRATLAGVAAALVAAGTAGAVIGLPSDGSQVNNDPAAGIDPNQNAGVSDVVGGSLVAGGPRVPWATFEQKAGDAQRIFVRAFKNGQWVTQGPSLNIDQNVEAEAPSIDFAGAGRTVPWDAWYEPNAALGGEKQIFASRFVAANNVWQPEGQDRGSGVPSLNINTDKEAENPSVAGGAAVAGADPVPWVAWEEEDGNVNGSGNHDQIFVSKGVKQAAPNSPCAGFKPSANASVSNFCWQQVGLDRLAKDGGSSPTGDPTLNIDPSRNGVEPDITFTGPSDTVGWTVWYEKDPSNIGLRNNEQVFAAKIVKDANADGGFHWQAVGNGTAGKVNVLDTSGKGFGSCAESTDAEDACSLNKLAGNDAEDPRVATGTLTPGGVTVPWVTWSEDVGGHHAIFVSRLVSGDHFELFNAGNPVSGPERGCRHAGHHVLREHAVRLVDVGQRNGQARLRRALRRLRPVRVGHAGRHPPDQREGWLLRRPRVADRRPRGALLELHRGPVHRRRHDVRAGRSQRRVRHVHHGGHPAAPVLPGPDRRPELRAVLQVRSGHPCPPRTSRPPPGEHHREAPPAPLRGDHRRQGRPARQPQARRPRAAGDPPPQHAAPRVGPRVNGKPLPRGATT